MSKKPEKLAITLIKSSSGRLPKHKATLTGLGGLKRIGQTAYIIDSPCVQGMIKQISYMIKVEKAHDAS